MMASQTGYNDVGGSGQGISSELRARDLPSKRLLGKGLASIGYETEWKGERFARKDFIGVPSSTFQKEAAVLVGLKDHRNVVKTHARTVDKMSCSLVLEYMEDDLLGLSQKRKESQGSPAAKDSGNQSELSCSQPFELPEALDIVLQIARGMEYLHEQGILHGDLKTKNILVTPMNDGGKNLLSVKVADFGLVRTKRKSMSFVSRQARKFDVVKWKPPEILGIQLSEDKGETSSESDSSSDDECRGSQGVTNRLLLAADVYSFAVTSSQILAGEDPYPNLNWKQLAAKIMSGELRPRLPAACPPLLKDLLVSCWGKAPSQRPTFSDIRTTLEHLHNLQTQDVPREAGRTAHAEQHQSLPTDEMPDHGESLAPEIERQLEASCAKFPPRYHRSTLLARGLAPHSASGGRRLNGGIMVRSTYKSPTVNIRPPKWTDNSFWIRADNYEEAQFIADGVYYHIGKKPFHFHYANFPYPPLRLASRELLTREMCSTYVESIAKGPARLKQREEYRDRVKDLLQKVVKSDEAVLFLKSLRGFARPIRTNFGEAEDSMIVVDGNEAASTEDGSHSAGLSAEEAAGNFDGDESTEQATPMEVDSLSDQLKHNRNHTRL